MDRLHHPLRVQARVLDALLRRELLTRYGRHNIGALWLVVEPMLFTLGVATVWSLAGLHLVSDLPVVAFAITGYSSVLIWRNACSRCLQAVTVNAELLYHRQVRVLDLLAARAVLEIVGATASLVLLTVTAAALDWMRWPADPLLALQAWILLGWFALALGLAVGALAELSDLFERVWHVVTYLLFPLSGAVFMLHWLPEPARAVVTWLPMVHGVEQLRHGYFGGQVPTLEEPGYLVVANLLLTLGALLLVRRVADRGGSA